MKVYSRFFKAVFFITFCFGILEAQNFDPISIPFKVNGKTLQNPLIGGLTAPQFVSFDLDGEGPEDLIVFERNGNVILPFINLSTPGNPNYLYAPEYTPSFPRVIKFLKIIDFNGDGKKDLFALSPKASGIEVWINTTEGNTISFEFMKFNFGVGDFLQIPAGNGYTNLFVSSIDIPEIIDTDGDGDLDILTFEPGGSYMYHYQNMVKEMGLPNDTLVYKTSDLCWGNFFESGVDEAILLSNDRSKCFTGLVGNTDSGSERHAGSTVTAFDGDGDGDLDMLLGDISNTGFVYLTNDEQNGDPFIISQELDFPSNTEEANISIFLGSFILDIDNDGKRDLIVCPNNELGSDNINHIWFYRNIGEDDAPVFELVQKDFLHETTLQMGHSSHPCFVDYNADGLMDILVGMNYILRDAQAESISLYLYENVGTKSQPSYELVDDNYLGLADDLSEFNSFLAPALGDLDGDGDDDIIVADNRSYLFYFENKGGEGNPYEFDNYIYEYKDLRVGTNGKPAIIDLDGDGLTDIVIGEKNDNGNPSTDEKGGLNFYKNIGSIGNPDFIAEEKTFPNTDILGQVFTKTISDASGSSSPYFFTSEGELYLAVGSRGGNIYIYNSIEDNIYGAFNEVTNELPILNSGRRTSIALDDIDNDGYHEMIVGNDNGGLMAFNTEFVKGPPSNTVNNEKTLLKVNPNPSSQFIKADVSQIQAKEFEIIGINGVLLRKGAIEELVSGLDIQNLPSGIYILSIKTDKRIYREKFIKQ
ncbi:MAG: T9SS type A sorting domain-containing protein [Saprospiraceae bacterium]|nr:T9SS type A sorting domain-containing protein [Saprospiraceae bacterium]